MNTQRLQKTALLLIVALLIAYAISRLSVLMALPPFIDEGIHIDWASDVYRGRFFTGVNDSRLLALWWMALFQLYGGDPLFMVRAATVLYCILSVALLYSIGKRLGNRWAGLLAAALYVLYPFAFFYDRLAMPDSYIGTFALLALWFGLRGIGPHPQPLRRARGANAALAGLSLAAAILVKAQGVIVIAVPALAYLLLDHQLYINLKSRWAAGSPSLPAKRGVGGEVLFQRIPLKTIAITYGTLAIIWIPLILFMRARGYNFFSVATNIASSNQGSLIERIGSNWGAWWDLQSAYLTPIGLALVGLGCIYLLVRNVRVGLICTLTLASLVVPTLLFGTIGRGRYIEYQAAFLVLPLALGLAQLSTDAQRWIGQRATMIVLTVLVALWGIGFALPFQAALHETPADAPLPKHDREEYVQADSAGFGIDQMADYLLKEADRSQRPLEIVGVISNCRGLSLSLPNQKRVTVLCPYINFNGGEQPNIAALINKRATEITGDLWLTEEGLPYASLQGVTVPYQKIATFERPGGITRINLYKVVKGKQ